MRAVSSQPLSVRVAPAVVGTVTGISSCPPSPHPPLPSPTPLSVPLSLLPYLL